MGIVNVTPDSFSDGGQFSSVEAAVEHAKSLLADGADILDIGGESTRPGAEPVSVDEEIKRTLPVIKHLSELGIPLSIDTRKAAVARAAIEAGARLWNDVSALGYDEDSLSTAAELGCHVVLMHMRGDPLTMQDNPQYDNVVSNVRHDLIGRVQAAMFAGVEKNRIILDPGIGFGKRQEDNIDLLRHIDTLVKLDYPVLLGTSRKSFISRIDQSPTDARLGGSVATAIWGAQNGVGILRVHDVKETVQALKVWQAVSTPDPDNGPDNDNA